LRALAEHGVKFLATLRLKPLAVVKSDGGLQVFFGTPEQLDPKD
jgi:hypothetical protein